MSYFLRGWGKISEDDGYSTETFLFVAVIRSESGGVHEVRLKNFCEDLLVVHYYNYDTIDIYDIPLTCLKLIELTEMNDES